MAATHANTTRAAKARASAGSNDRAARGRGEAEKATPSPGMLAAIQQSLPEWLATLEGPRKFAINGLMVVASLLGSGVIVKATLKQVHVVEAISVPKDLEADGYTPATVGQRLIDAVSEVTRTAAVAKRIGVYALWEAQASQSDASDTEGPDQAYLSDSPFSLTCDDPTKKYDVSVGGVSLTTVILYIRELFGLADTRISGEITVDNAPAPGAGGKDGKPSAKKFSMRLRITGKNHVEHEAEATDKLETLFQQAALKLVERFDPLHAAYYSYYKRDFDNARRIVRAYLADPEAKDDSKWGYNLLGLLEHAATRHDPVRAEQGFDKAIAEFKKLRKTEPQFEPAFYNLSYILIDKGKKRLGAQDKETAHALFSEAYKVALEGIAVHEARDKTSRGRAAGYATVGRALRYLGKWDARNYDEALRYFDQSITADRMFISAYLSQGWIHQHRDAPANASAVYQLATELSPSAQTFTRVGLALQQHGQHPESVPMFQRAAEIERSAKAYTDWGVALRRSDRADEARAIFAKALDVDPNLANGYNEIGLSYLREGKWGEAAEQFVKAISLDSRWSNYHYNLGFAYRRDGKYDDAISSFEKAIAIFPTHASSHAQLGVALAEREGRDRGSVAEETAKSVEQELKRAVELKPNDQFVLKTVAQGYRRLGWSAQAIEADRRAAAAGDRTQGGLEPEIKRLERAAGEF
jgi:tetratricopeptide (TPR) repeat protein